MSGICAVVLHDDGTAEVLFAEPDARISDELLAAVSDHIEVDGNLVTLCGDVTYELTGWDAGAHAHVASIVSSHITPDIEGDPAP